MKTIWKYHLEVEDYNAILMPKGAVPLSVQVQHGDVRLWCMIDPDEKEDRERVFRIVGTGYGINNEESLQYIGTFQLYDGDFIGHVFEVLRD